jgi:serine/threonine-protein kinase
MSPPLEQERFLPGTVVAERYRIYGLLGRGGMGEVYRADDLRLGQPVALKFLPRSVERDEERRARFLNEVKIARQISHPNVCRVYDVGEVDGHHYLSMEYVDGEDLASLLRRIGRLPQDKAVQISRELCLGLAAAHELGILHRDLKPANVMIDGRGRAKIADFGLATIADEIGGAEIGAGTPAYMSPEQRAGTNVTLRSDLYSLGLVLYELTTGKPAFTVQGETTPTSPSSLVPGMDPAAERAILRCLQSDPVLRPASALAVAAALPGGDPLAEAVAAGETPSPQMVANAAAPGSLPPIVAWACLIASVALAFVSILAIERVQVLRLLPLGKNPEALADRARETIERLDYKPLPYEMHGFGQNGAYLDHIETTDASAERWERLRNGQPSALRFWLRQSPVALAPGNPANTLTTYADPSFTVAGSVGVWLDTKGRLVQLDAVPPKHEPATSQSVEHAATKWSVLFEAAGMKIEDFRAVAAEWSPLAFADERQAWEGVYPDAKDIPIRIEAAAFAGRPVSFRIIEPWVTPRSDSEDSQGLTPYPTSVVDLVLPIVILIGGALLAVRNIKLGRSDRRGAFRIGMYLFVVRMLVWMFMQNDLTGELANEVFVANFSFSLYRFVLVWICYVAIEPYLRRFWPRTLISWTRVLEGRWRDPLVGRDFLLGALIAGLVWLWLNAWPMAFLWLGMPQRMADVKLDGMTLKALGGLRPALSAMLFMHAQFVLGFGFSMIVLLVLLRLLTRRTWIAVTIWIPIAALVAGPSDAALVMFLVLSVVTLAILFRLGVLCLMVVLGLSGLQVPIPATFSTSAWYAGPSWLFLGVFTAVAVYGFVVSIGGRRAFSGILAEE